MAKGRATSFKTRGLHPEVRQLVKELRAQGVEPSMTKAGHLKVKVAGKGMRSIPQSPSDVRSILNAREHLRQLGLDV